MVEPGPTSVPWQGIWPRGPSIETVNIRVDGLERTLQDVVNMVRSMESNLVERIDKQAAKPTNLLQLGGFVLSLFVAFGGFAWYAKSGVDTDIMRLERTLATEAAERKQDGDKFERTLAPIAAVAAQHENDLRRVDADERIIGEKWSKDAQTEYEKRIDERYKIEHEYAQRDLLRVEGHIQIVDGNQIKRPEIESAFRSLQSQGEATNKSQDQRSDALSTRLNGIQNIIESLFPASEVIREMQQQIRDLRQTPAIAPIAPIAPLAPVAPAK